MRIRSIKYRIRDDTNKFTLNQDINYKSQSSHQYRFKQINNQSNLKKISICQTASSTIADAYDMDGKGKIQILKKKCLSKYAEQEKQNFSSFSQHRNSHGWNGLNGSSKNKGSQIDRQKSSSKSLLQPLKKATSTQPTTQAPYISSQNIPYQLCHLQTNLTKLSTELCQQKEKSTKINKQLEVMQKRVDKQLVQMNLEFGMRLEQLGKFILRTNNQKSVLMLNWKDTIQQKQQQYIQEQQQILLFQTTINNLTQSIGTQLIGLTQNQLNQ